MALTPEQIKELKEQLKSQVNHLPPDQKSAALEQIDSMSSEAIETMLKQQQAQQSPENSIFRSIISGEIPSTKIDENYSALAVLDINPISKGHIMIIPKQPVENPKEVPQECFDLAKSLSEKITSKLGAKSVDAETTQQFGEAIIHLIPSYDKKLNLQSPRSKASEEDLSALASELKKETIKIEKPKPEVISEENKEGASKKQKPIKLQRRIP